jgi:hypothetical protein
MAEWSAGPQGAIAQRIAPVKPVGGGLRYANPPYGLGGRSTIQRRGLLNQPDARIIIFSLRFCRNSGVVMSKSSIDLGPIRSARPNAWVRSPRFAE